MKKTDFLAIRKYNNMKIGKKLTFSYLLTVFIPVLLVGLILIHSMNQMVVEQAISEAKVNVDRVYLRFDELLRIAMDISYMAHIDKNLQDVVLKEYESAQQVMDAYNIYKGFNNNLIYYSRQIEYIRLYVDNETMLNNGQFIKAEPAVRESEWFKRAEEANGRIVWQYTYDDIGRDSNFALTTVVRANYGYRSLGMLVIRFNRDYLLNLLKSEPFATVICDDQGNIVGAGERKLIGHNIKDTVYSVADDKEQGVWVTEYEGHPAKAIVKTFSPSISNEAFRIISIVPLSTINEKTAKTALLGISIMAASLLVSFLLITLFTKGIGNRMRAISLDMHKVAMGHFDYIPTVRGEDEMGQLSKDLETMSLSLKELVKEINEVNVQKNQLAIRQKEIKLKMLANQINPHFLFNALETVRMKAHTRGEHEIAGVVKLIGKIMRRNLEIGNHPVTLAYELEMVKNYLDIQIFRYGERVQYSIHVEEDALMERMILPLIIQPIVENAVIHGIENKKGVGKIDIGIFKDGELLKIKVSDNGAGMEPEQLQRVRNSLAETEDGTERRIGLTNIHQRIRLFYGEAYGLSLTSESSQGTQVVITLPGKDWDNV